MRQEPCRDCEATDYVRGRMIKTRVGVWPTRFLEIETTNRHHVALRGIGTLTRKTHLRLADGPPPAPRWGFPQRQ